MIIHALCVTKDVRSIIEGAGLIAQMRVETHGTSQDFATALFRDSDSMGVFWSGGAVKATESCREWRRGAHVRNILLSLVPVHAAAHTSFVSVLAAGADDVQSDTIDIRELAARFQALRRRAMAIAPPINILGCTFEPTSGLVAGPAGPVRLTKCESKLLGALIQRNGAVVTKEMILAAIYGGVDEPALKIIDVFVCKLRKKLFHVLGNCDVVETVWGRGYRFEKNGIKPNFDDRRNVRSIA